VKQSKERAQALSQHSATLAEAVDHDQSNMPPLMLHFVSQLSEARAAMAPITERSWISRLSQLNRNEGILDTFNHCLNEAQQRFMVCQQYFVTDFSSADSNDWYPQGWYCHSDKSRGITVPGTYRRQPRMPPLL
jgi:hypothetical protein